MGEPNRPRTSSAQFRLYLQPVNNLCFPSSYCRAENRIRSSEDYRLRLSANGQLRWLAKNKIAVRLGKEFTPFLGHLNRIAQKSISLTGS